MNADLIARKNIKGEIQSLSDHAHKVADISKHSSHFPNTSELLAMLHDLGKATKKFQRYITEGVGERGSVIHAWQGAMLANELFQDDNSKAGLLLKDALSFCVTAHHNQLADGVSPDGSTDYFDKLSNTQAQQYAYEEVKEALSQEDKNELSLLFTKAKQETEELLYRIGNTYEPARSKNFAIGLFIKYLFSCLVDADRFDAYLFDTGEKFNPQAFAWAGLTDVFEQRISAFSHTREIDFIRKSVSEKCKGAASKETGIYQLSVPTGGGKTLSSLRFAMHHSIEQDKKRIIYVIPYLSIIDQTAKEIRNILDLPLENNILFEHHSNITEPEDDTASDIRKLSSARWDSPIIVTTMVQFLESVMSAKSGDLRKFASMADAVIIFDEIQSLPTKSVHCFNEVVSFLSAILNTTILLCSATQPTLEETQRRNLLLHREPYLIDCKDDFKDIKRVTISPEKDKDYEEAGAFVLQKALDNGNCLVIVNTKKSASQIYKNLLGNTEGFKVLHLSTAMCPAHRSQTIEEIKVGLRNSEKIICVSTQLIEAGVDISFTCVIRAMAGLDSIAQAAGRCNRNGESPDPKIVYTFALNEEDLGKLNDIKDGQELTKQIIETKNPDLELIDDSIMHHYYVKYFEKKEKNGELDYPVKYDTTLYRMLSDNKLGRDYYQNRTGKQFQHMVPQAFRTAGEEFYVIEKNTRTVIALFNNTKVEKKEDQVDNLVDAYNKQPKDVFTKEKLKVLKKLQQYSVSLFEHEYNKLRNAGALHPLDEDSGVMLLCTSYYSQETGVILEPIHNFNIC